MDEYGNPPIYPLSKRVKLSMTDRIFKIKKYSCCNGSIRDDHRKGCVERVRNRYDIIIMRNIEGIEAVTKCKLKHGKMTGTLHFARLNDQEGMRYTIELNDKLTYKHTCSLIMYFLKSQEYWGKIKTVWDIFAFCTFVQNEYYISFYDKYYHFVVALDYKAFELESKGIPKGLFTWNDSKPTNYVTQISDTIYHMWNDNKNNK